jgi:hypothetical protein
VQRKSKREEGNEELLYWFSSGLCGGNGGFYERAGVENEPKNNNKKGTIKKIKN